MEEQIVIALVMITLITSITFVLRTSLQTWGRVRRDRHMAEIQNKLMDRLGTAPDVMTYVNSDAYRKLLEGADTGGNNHASRVLNAMQFGLVLLCGGVGMLATSGLVRDDGGTFLQVIGGIVVAIGIGLAASAVWSLVLLRKWGLLKDQSGEGTQN
jgi:hypothetical protein